MATGSAIGRYSVQRHSPCTDAKPLPGVGGAVVAALQRMSTRLVLLLLAVAASGCATSDEHATEPETGTGSGKADDPSASFLASLPGWGRYIVLDQLKDIVPVYLAETRSVLAKID